MEVRERRSAREQNAMLTTVESSLPMEVKDLEQLPEAHDYLPPTSARSISKSELDQNWPYPVKPAFPNNDFDSDEDSDDESEDMALMTTCCCCFSTKNGSIIVGIVSLIIAFLISVTSCFALINVDEISQDVKQSFMNYQDAVKNNKTINSLAILTGLMDLNVVIDNLRIVFIVFLAFYAIYTFSSLFLIYGACSDLRSLLLPWIVLEFVPFAIQLAGIVLVFVYGKDDPTLSQGGIYIIVGLAEIIGFVTHVYWWMCPVAHYQNLKEFSEVQPLIPPSHPMYPTIPKY